MIPLDSAPIGHFKGWMSAAAQFQPLLYVASPYVGVYVFSYPAGLLEGQLSGFEDAQPPCTDAAGHVFVPDAAHNMIFEYAHGNAVPIQTIPGEQHGTPVGCTVNSATGDLVVVSNGDVLIYSPIRDGRAPSWGLPKILHDANIVQLSSCTSNAAGDTFISGQTGVLSWALAELPEHQQSFTEISVPPQIQQYRDIRWDGKHIAVVSDSNNVYRLSIMEGRATISGVTRLQGAYGISGISFFPDVGPKLPSRIIVPDFEGNNVGYWAYPNGGQPQKIILDIPGAGGTTVSQPVSQ
ncbi:MAG: hypothetical protein JO092_08805 [Candidatus Eremiobacteraeota bacterium]|nr:hypothetical protein [Candidatus Eremiobacteraeota bacterium]